VPSGTPFRFRARGALRAKAETAHPFFWPPFVLVGDGGATR
jgi:CHAT domain-containing protein